MIRCGAQGRPSLGPRESRPQQRPRGPGQAGEPPHHPDTRQMALEKTPSPKNKIKTNPKPSFTQRVNKQCLPQQLGVSGLSWASGRHRLKF